MDGLLKGGWKSPAEGAERQGDAARPSHRRVVEDRQRHRQFSLPHPVKGVIRMFQDAVVESSGACELAVVSPVAGRPGDRLMVDRLGSGPTWRTGVRVVDSRATFIGGMIRHRLRLAVEGPERNDEFGPIVSGLVLTLPVRILAMNQVGCLLQTGRAIDVGTTAELEATTGEGTYLEPIRICRSTRIPGCAFLFRAWAEFPAR